MSYRILIADDDLEDLELIEDAILSVDSKIELQKFTSGFTVIEHLNSKLDQDLPNLIILDYNMPQLNGAQLLLTLKAQERYRSIPKVVLSTSNAAPHIHECLKNGATEYFIKPDSINSLRNLAQRLLALC